MSAPGSAPSADRNLLFGILALQMDFVNRDALIKAMHAWVLQKATPLGQILLDQGALSSDTHALLQALVQKHLEMHGGDAHASLKAVSSLGSVRQQLEQIGDAEVRQSLGHIAAARAAENDPFPTLKPPDGVLASAKQRFRILRPHAEGGLGKVFVAHDEELSREVALKEIKDRLADDKNSRSRFVLEAEITGGLEHPGIVPVYGLGQYADGRPFYAMRFIRGDSLQDAITRFHRADTPDRDVGERTLSLRQLLARFLDVCNAIAYAHSRGVLHRDLKPGNVILGKYGETLVVDWGLAKPLGQPEGTTETPEGPLQPSSASGSAPTQMGSAIGTPAYMPPEQAAGRLDQLGPASDVYSLGATLYCLLTGVAPFEGKDLGAVLWQVQRGEFRPPRQVKPAVAAALQAVCLKAMALRPEDRYASPRALAEDVEHWLADEPVGAWREPWGMKARRWVGRHRTLVTAGAATLLVATVSLTAATVLLQASNTRERQANADKEVALGEKENALAETRKQKQQADDNAAQARDQKNIAEKRAAELKEERDRKSAVLANSLVLLANHEWEEGHDERAWELLADVPGYLRCWEWNYLRGKFQGSYCTLYGHSGIVTSVAYSLDGKLLASGSRDSSVKVWDTATGTEVLTLKGHIFPITSVAFSPDSKLLASGSEDTSVKVWDVTTSKEVCTLFGELSPVSSVAFSPDGKRLAASFQGKFGMPGDIKVWDAATGQEVLPLKGDYLGGVTSVTFSPDGKYLVGPTKDRTVKVWDAATGKEVRTFTLKEHIARITSVAFSPDGKRLASGSWDRTVRVWDVATGQPIFIPWVHTAPVTSVAFSPDGKRLVSGLADGTLKVRDMVSGRTVLTLRGHARTVTSVAFCPDGKRLASASADCTVKEWDMAADQQVFTPIRHTHETTSVAFSPDGKRLASGFADGTVKMWVAATGQEVSTPRGHLFSVTNMVFNADGKRLASGSRDNTVKTWDTTTGQEALTLKAHVGDVANLVFSPDDKQLAIGSGGLTESPQGEVKVWNATTGKEVRSLSLRERTALSPFTSVVFGPDGKRLASGSRGGKVTVLDTATGHEILVLKGHTADVVSMAYSIDGKLLASGSKDWTVKVWDAAKGQELLTLKGHVHPITSVAFSPDGKRLASTSDDNTLKIWDTATGQKVLTLKENTTNVVFSPNGKRLAASGRGKFSMPGEVKVWYAATGQKVLLLKGHIGAIISVAFSPDGKLLASGSKDRMAMVWNLATGKEVRTFKGHTSPVTSVAFSPDGKLLASGSGWFDMPRDVKVWEVATGEEVHTFEGNIDGITSVAFSPDGKTLWRDGTDKKAWDLNTGKELSNPGQPPTFAELEAPAKSPFASYLAFPAGNIIQLVNFSPPDADELAFRKAKARFDPFWHEEQAAESERESAWFAAAFHRALLAENAPWDLKNWTKLQNASKKLGDYQHARSACDRILQRDPTLAPIYLQRSLLCLRAKDARGAWPDFFRCAYFSLIDHPDWTEFAKAANKLGDEAADKNDWPQAVRHLTLASAWQPHDPWALHRLAWAMLAAGDEEGCRSVCRRLYARFGNLEGRRDFLTLSAWLGQHIQPLTPAPLVIDGAIQQDAVARADAIAYTACLLPNCGIDPKALVALAAREVEANSTSNDFRETYGAALYRAGKYPESVKQLEEAVRLHGKDGSNWQKLFLAMAYQRLGQTDKSRTWFDKAKLGDEASGPERLIYHRLRQEAEQLRK